ncbi:hypothetical protein [Pseudoalteromonas sp. S16_S37]|uniref:hypothetical protein n=1 Tax=Pseudoalteromonas sp. S16_S37 TaxID=2720228 RepID=UPI0016810990|nr:hypothetical protein [Pseudoalteromonas sp. S16_S37]MBD1582771.1 hypothetical protein [Pseudoalteromonas sp. S16_S37]
MNKLIALKVKKKQLKKLRIESWNLVQGGGSGGGTTEEPPKVMAAGIVYTVAPYTFSG